MADFNEATTVKQTEPGCYDIDIDGTWSVGDVPNGGYLLALILQAVSAESPHPHPVSTSAHFVAPPSPGHAQINVHLLRAGRTTATLRATLVQDDIPRVEALITTSTLDRDADVEWAGPTPEPVAPVDECIPAVVDLPDGTHVGLLEHVDLRLDPQTLGWFSGRPAGQLSMRGHVRLVDGTQPSPIVLALAVDSLPPTVFGLGRLGWAPTVELSVLTRSLPAPGWLTVHLRGRLVRDGWFDEEAEVYDSDGSLVAQSRQLARVRVG
ncbi:thioesterase family protein [Phytoactinopolyspora halotolerans]|uniref:Thioesterase family protein n=1 Tax=Phytoactinopolyspora halotolerans TaxID=1981512 RepID=A0A6L9S310_9ACTN|nr:thioesterase family protein [Phytoactinopolyspora halotolerans]NED99013.1 thioesterase family protein [Phytoactinopolyspora halotolerans]